ncbi:RICIN domain-containing protein [Streptomyces sp. NPDC088789]|uniref:RICIN domain-containing protein n=1 Tax=Streptomyces sp. NPDC088789 TaxID=3365899 RepID=UPI0037FE1F4B
MPTPHPLGPPHPAPGRPTGASDESLAARLGGGADGEVAHATALLIARHWSAVRDYAVICLATSADLADMVTGAAFHQVCERLTHGGTGVALRPGLLVTVRDTVRLWSADDRIAAALPEVRKPAGGRGLRTATSLTPENRALAERAFHGLPGVDQCLLWHTEVEAEPISVPAELLGMDVGSASVALEHARDAFREGLVRAHRELTPSKDCGYHNRLLDVPLRRGGALLPDVQQHLAGCRYCRDAAEQLSHFEGGLDLLLAEAVLGWGARRYRDSRPGRVQQGQRGRAAARRAAAAGRRRITFPLRYRAPVGARPSRALLTGVGVVTSGLLAAVLGTALWGDGGATDPVAADGSGGGGTQGAGVSAPPREAGLPGIPPRTRLRNIAADACLDIRGEAKDGAGTELAVCSDEATQLWSYDRDGLLRSAVEPGLCLDSRVDAGVVIVGRCADQRAERADDVRYDLTVQGELLPRWDERLALASTTEDLAADIVVKVRDGSAGQRWRTDPPAGPGSLSLENANASPRAAEPAEE